MKLSVINPAMELLTSPQIEIVGRDDFGVKDIGLDAIKKTENRYEIKDAK